ncbi:MAG: site-specific integrase [Thermodesulfobacteriota bacterium]
MATFEKRGPSQWRAKVRKKGFRAQTDTFGTRKDAEAWAKKVESEMDQGLFVSSKEAQRTTLGEALERYATEVSAAKKSVDMELCRIRKWREHPLALRSLASLRGMDFAKYRDERLAAGKAANTIRLELAIVSHLFTIAKKEWGMESLANPVQAIRLPSPGRPRERRLVGDEEERLLVACENSRSSALKDLAIVAIETAMRQGELLSLRWPNIDLQKKVAHLPETKNGESRNVPLSSRALEVLRRRPRSFKDDRVFFEWKAASGLKHTWSRALQRAGIEDFHFHDLRHEAISRFFERTDLKEAQIMRITGHKTFEMLLRYTHLRAEDLAAKLG